MLRISLLMFCLAFTFKAMALQNDTTAYQTQRLKINSLLAERSAKFGQYDLSLSARTGIFGLQTKQDLKNSNEILRNIILNDNNIFRELKTLMNYKDLQVQEVQSDASITSKRMAGYMLSIKKLQDQNDALRAELDETTAKTNTEKYIIIFLAFLLIASSVIFYIQRRRGGAQ